MRAVKASARLRGCSESSGSTPIAYAPNFREPAPNYLSLFKQIITQAGGITLSVGACVPSSCNNEDLTELIKMRKFIYIPENQKVWICYTCIL